MHRERAQLESQGARLVVVGNGQPWFIKGFREKLGYEGEVYTDPTRASFQALQLRRGVRASLNRRALRKAFDAYRDGFRQTGTRGDPWQQGGVFVVDTEGTMRFSYASEHAGDHPPIPEIVHAIRPGG